MSIVYSLRKIRKLKTIVGISACLILTASCTSSRKTYDPTKKYSPVLLRADYSLFRQILETSHPSIYWYTTKDSMDYYFDQVYKSLDTPMSEIQLREQMSYVISKIDCGHTTMKGSKAFNRYADTSFSVAFPFALKFWADTMVITANLRRTDHILKRGTIVTSIGGYNAVALTDTLFKY